MNTYTSLPICNEALSDGHGFVKELEQKMSADQIRSLELQGLIRNAISKDGNTWKLTRKGREIREMLEDRRSPWTRLCDRVLSKVLRMKIEL